MQHARARFRIRFPASSPQNNLNPLPFRPYLLLFFVILPDRIARSDLRIQPNNTAECQPVVFVVEEARPSDKLL